MTGLEIVFRAAELVVSIGAVAVVVFGWIVPHKQAQKDERKRRIYVEIDQKQKWKKEFIDKQISLLYGPLDALIREKEISRQLIHQQIGRSYIFKENGSFSDLSEEEQKIWAHYVDTYKIPRLNEMRKILRENVELMYDSEIPSCVFNFLDYAIGWELLDNQKKNGVKNYYEYYYRYNYPKSFDRYVKETLASLLKQQAELMKEIRPESILEE